jgi:putative flippase GtrA
MKRSSDSMIKSKLTGWSKLVDKRSAFFFLVVGAVTTFSYFGLFALFYNLLHMHYRLAISIAYLLAILIHFMGNRILAFQSHGNYLTRHVLRFAAMVLMNYVITMIVMHAVVTEFNLSPYLGILFSIALTVGVGYLVAKFWVFTTPKKK